MHYVTGCAKPSSSPEIIAGPYTYYFRAAGSAETPVIYGVREAADDVTGLVAHHGKTSDCLLVVQKDVIGVFDAVNLNLLASITLTGEQDIEVPGLSVPQEETTADGARHLGLRDRN